jgi:hypothetical protein
MGGSKALSKVTSLVNSFTSGEWSPKAKGRFDLAKYASGAGILENFIINQLGGVSYRPGTRYIAETKTSSLASRLIPFQCSADSDYVIEAGNQYFKLYENDTDAVVNTVADTYTKLLIHANGVDAYGIYGGSVIDSSTAPRAVTKNGSAEISPAQFKFGNAALRCAGAGAYLSCADHADWSFGVGNFTVNFWVKFTDVTNDDYMVGQYANGGNYWYCRKSATGTLNMVFITGTTVIGSYVTTAGGLVANDIWYHMEFTRNGITALIFLNGVSQALTEATAFAANDVGDVAFALTVGKANVHFDGWLDEVRVSKGIARNVVDFAVPTAEYTADANTQLLLHFNTLDSSSTTAPKITTFVGTAQLDTAAGKFKYGTAALLLDGNSDSVTVPDSADFNFGTGDFTIEAFVMFAGIGAVQTLCGQYEDANNYWFARIDAANKLQIMFVDGGVTMGDYIMTNAWAGLGINTYYHIAFVRNESNVYIFIDGTAQTVTTTTAILANDVGDMAAILDIGKRNAANYWNGWIDEFRISKGLARYTADFTAPAAEFALTPIVTTEVTTPYLTAELFDIQYAQNNDVLYLVHKNWAPRKLTRTSATAFTLSTVALVRPPFLDTNTVVANTITPSADTGNGITLTAVNDTFLATNIGGYYRVKSGVVKITAFTSTKILVGNVQAEPSGVAGDLATGPGATADWAESAWSDRRGWPSSVAFHEQRLYYAGTTYEPQKFWGSYIGAYDSFDQTAVTDNYAITFEVATEQRNAIKWLSSGNKSLAIGTQGGTFAATSGETTSTIAPDNIVVSRDSNYGVAGIMPKRISSYLYYLQRDYNKVRELAYSLEADAQVSNDMNLLAAHILKDGDGAVDLDHQQSPNDRIYCVRDDGQMSVLTRNAEQEVMGWSRFIAGTDAQGMGEFESVCVIPKASADDQVWVIVKRNINGSVKRFIEFFMVEDFDDDWDAIRCDCSLSLDAPSTVTGVTIANDLVLYTAGTVALADGDQIKINGVVGTTDINGTFLVDTLTLGVSFKLKTLAGVAVDFATYGAWISGGEIRKMVTNISGLDHLVGETVVAQTDGYIPSTETYTVAAGGSIILSEKAAVVHVGLPFTGTIQLLKLSDGSPTGTGQTKERRIYLGTLRLYRSQGLSIGRTSTTLDALNYNEETDPEALFTGDMPKVFQTTWSKADELIISQTKPLPAEILAIIFRSEVEEG